MAGSAAEQAGGCLKRRSPGVQARASVNEINVREEIVMGDIITAAAKSNVVLFRSATLLLIEKDGQPFVPMKPVVEGMGLAWAAQTVKLNSNKDRWGVSMIETPSNSGVQQYLCIPLKKLFGWLMTLHPSKVREEIRTEILAYQNECDEVLWLHWNRGRVGSEVGASVAAKLLGLDGARTISNVIRNRVARLDSEHQRSAGARISSALHARFGVPRIELIPADQMDSACNFVAAFAIEGEYLPKGGYQSVDIPTDLSETQRYLVFTDGSGKRQVQSVPFDACVMSPTQFLAAVTGSNGIHVPPAMLFDFALAAMEKVKWRVAA